jgi:RHS repeat-associated protein
VLEYDVDEGRHTMTAAQRMVISGLISLTSMASVYATETVTYYLTDAQGSVIMTEDAQGNTTGEYDYRPYGASQGALAPVGPGYTGHVNDPDTGLVYMQQRYYDPDGQFLSVDPVRPSPGKIFTFGRYTYANDNPYRYVDPFGLYTCSGDTSDCTKIDTFVANIDKAKKNLDPTSDGYKKLDAVTKYLGKPGEKNGVTITAASLGKGILAQAGKNGQISVDVKQVTNMPSGWYAANPKHSAAEVQNAFGAGAVAHESRHELDFKRLGFPATK